MLDAHPGGIIYRDIIPEYVNFARTIYEGLCLHLSLLLLLLITRLYQIFKILLVFYQHGIVGLADDFGDVVVDVNYLNVGGIDPSYEIFIC